MATAWLTRWRASPRRHCYSKVTISCTPTSPPCGGREDELRSNRSPRAALGRSMRKQRKASCSAQESPQTRASPSPRRQPALVAEEGDHLIHPFAGLHVRHHERSALAHRRRVARHHFERGADVRGEVDLVDDEQVRAGDAGAAFARDFFAARDVDDIDGEISELRRERGGEI